MNRIDRRFAALASAKRTGLIPYIAAGDPSPTATVALMHALARAGADVIELGVPFSDPSADGPVIQRAAERAIANGVGLARTLELVAEFRRDDGDTPAVLMGYANSFERLADRRGGMPVLVAALKDAGVDGVLVVDYPPEESEDFAAALKAAGIACIYLLAPTSSHERIARVAAAASGYLYYVSLKGITGSAALDTSAVAARMPALRRATSVPVGVGFGIRDAAGAVAVGAVADAVVIGSRIIEAIESAGEAGAVAAVETLVGGIRRALDEASGARHDTSEALHAE